MANHITKLEPVAATRMRCRSCSYVVVVRLPLGQVRALAEQDGAFWEKVGVFPCDPLMMELEETQAVRVVCSCGWVSMACQDDHAEMLANWHRVAGDVLDPGRAHAPRAKA